MNTVTAGFTGGWEIWAICIVALVLFGGAAIPKFAKSLGRAKTIPESSYLFRRRHSG